MGLHVHVRCSCVAQGLALPHPNASLLLVDENLDPYLDWERAKPADWEAHERWAKNGCSHPDGYLVFKHLGNVSSIAYVRAQIELLARDQFPLITSKVVYSGIHAGDSVSVKESQGLLDEASVLFRKGADPQLQQFAYDLVELCEASLATGNPIVF